MLCDIISGMNDGGCKLEDVEEASRLLRMRRSSSVGVNKSLRLDGKKSSACADSASASSFLRDDQGDVGCEPLTSVWVLKKRPWEPG